MTEKIRIKRLFERLVRSECCPFPASGVVRLPRKHGVYVLRTSRGRVLHVGRTVRHTDGLFNRVNDHLRGRSSFVVDHLLGKRELLRRGCGYQFVIVSNARTRALLEAYATGMLCPAHLGTGARKPS